MLLIHKMVALEVDWRGWCINVAVQRRDRYLRCFFRRVTVANLEPLQDSLIVIQLAGKLTEAERINVSLRKPRTALHQSAWIQLAASFAL